MLIPQVVLFSTTAFVSAALLFIIQPLFAKIVLPLLGGSPSVWNTALVFYQATLLAGYVYAHASTRILGVRRQAIVHVLVLLLPLLVLPVRIMPEWSPPIAGNLVPWLLVLLTAVVGLPFFAVSTTAPLLQRWFSTLGLASSADPYFLYASSNAGSFLALLCYPLILEPIVPLSLQTDWWTAGYLVFLVLVAVSAVFVVRAKEPPEVIAPLSAKPPRPLRDRLPARGRWLIYSFVPSSLMIGVTTHVSMELAAVPLLWIVPLSLYLLSFVLVFSRRPPPHRLFVRALPIVALGVTFTFVVGAREPVGFVITLHFVLLFVASMVCHRELARVRPPAEDLTEFYLWLAAGGVLGGAFNALAAPLLFRGITEYPLMVVAALLAAPLGTLRDESPGSLEPAAGIRSPRSRMPGRAGDIAFAAALGVLTATLASTMDNTALEPRTKAAITFGVPALVAFGFSGRMVRFGLSVACILLVAQYVATASGNVLHSERTFFGVHRVRIDSTGAFRELLHGSVMHGRQRLDPSHRAEPIGYYGSAGPLGQVLTSVVRRPARVAVVGLGNGTMAAYALPGEAWTFFEIDKAVERIARDRRWFTYLADSPGAISVVIGDGRRSLATANEARYDVLILDAYSSDAIPVHLLTREAMQVYVSRLAAGGIIVVNTSNRHFDLASVVGALAHNLRLAYRIRHDKVISAAEFESGNVPSEWVVVARDPAHLGVLTTDPRWQKLSRTGRAWTDDHSAILRALR